MKVIKYHIAQFAWMLLTMLSLTACTEEVMTFFGSDEEIQPGESVLFTTYVPGKSVTRTAKDDFNAKMATYNIVADDYEFNVEMYEKTTTDSTLLGSATYLPTKTYTVVEEVVTDSTYATDGTLAAKTGQDSLYWPGNAKQYGFKATAGTTTLEADQSTKVKWLKQDKLLGYGFVPLWDGDDTNGKQVDDENKVNYHTSKEWYANNQSVGLVPVGQTATDYYKKIPLYMKHQRSLVTIILKAGEGVERSVLAYDKALTNIHTYVYSYSGDTKSSITPFPQQTTVDYVSGDFGTAADDVETTQYTAVVEPHDYLSGATSDPIAQIEVSNQRFTFYASNDDQYTNYTSNVQTAIDHMNGYNLTAGKHLVITATLGRASRKILITAYVEDWTEAVTTSVVDDYGQAGDPIQINSRQELYAFLADDTKNKPGNVAIIVPGTINLEKSGDEEAEWSTPMPLNCTLNMAGSKFYTNHRVFSTIGSSGNLVNGTIAVGSATVDAAVAEINLGTVERVNIVTTDASNNTSSATATRAGVVVTNSGTITDCTSVLTVKATSGFDGYIGGIAAESVYSEDNGSTMPVIDGCTVDAMVDEADGESTDDGKTYGGGIVGQAVGRVTNNRYEYGITIRQNATRLKNIVHRKAGTDETKRIRAYGNSWPTTALNEISHITDDDVAAQNINGTDEADRYTAVIDSQSDLEYLLGSATNTTTSKIRISNDFAVTGWTIGKKDDQLSSSSPGNVFFELDGNDKTITTDGMLFTNIQNHVHDLTVKLSANLIATHLEDGSEAIAALAYSVYGTGENSIGKISNIKVKGGDYRIQAATVGGIVVWAYKDAVIENCQCKANIQVWTSGLSAEAKIYAGGIAACAAKATFTQCTFHNTEGTLYQNTSTTNTETENGTETLTGAYYGGILGGTVPKGETGTEYPSVLITDCTSWFSTSGNAQKGAIVGYARYAEGSNTVNGIADDCQGNWWNTTADAVGTSNNSMTDEEVVGKRNAVKPTQDTTY